MFRDSIAKSSLPIRVLYPDVSGAVTLSTPRQAHLRIHATLLAIKLTPQIKLVAEAIALSGTLVIPVLTLMRVPVLRAIVKSPGVSPGILDQAARQATIDPKLETSGGANLDLVVGVCS